MSKFPGYDLQPNQLQSFLGLMQEWAKSLSTREAQNAVTFSYVLQTQKPQTVSPEAPMFPPPNLLNIQTYPYMTPKTGQTEAGLTKAGGRNMLLFILGSGAVQYPAKSLQWMGNLVMAGIPGTICLSREVMWDGFLLQKQPTFLMNDVNFVMCGYFHADKLTLDQGSNDYPKVDFGANYGINDANRAKDGLVYGWQKLNDSVWNWSKTGSDSKQASYRDKYWAGLDVDCKCTLLLLLFLTTF